MDRNSLGDSLFLAKRSIIDFLKDTLEEKRGFKYSLLAIATLKKWNNAINMWEFQNIYIRPDAITVLNQNFKLNDAFEKLMLLLDIWEGEGSEWIIDQIQDIHINVNNYDALAESSYIPLTAE